MMVRKLILLSSSMFLLYGCDLGSVNMTCSQSQYYPSSTSKPVCQYPPNRDVSGGFAIGLAFQNGDDTTNGASIPMPIAGNQQFRAKATYTDNQAYDVTNLVNWNVITTTGVTAKFDPNNKGLLKITNGLAGTINIHAVLQVPNQPAWVQDFTLQIIR